MIQKMKKIKQIVFFQIIIIVYLEIINQLVYLILIMLIIIQIFYQIKIIKKTTKKNQNQMNFLMKKINKKKINLQ